MQEPPQHQVSRASQQHQQSITGGYGRRKSSSKDEARSSQGKRECHDRTGIVLCNFQPTMESGSHLLMQASRLGCCNVLETDFLESFQVPAPNASIRPPYICMSDCLTCRLSGLWMHVHRPATVTSVPFQTSRNQRRNPPCLLQPAACRWA